MSDYTLFLDNESKKAVRNRLSRARGQLEAVIRQIDEDEACLSILPQMVAADKAVNRATFALLLAAMRNCARDPEHHPEESEQLQKIFLSLA